MIKELGAQGEPIWAILSTCLCFGIFLAVIVYLICDRRRTHHDRMGALPLDDGTFNGATPPPDERAMVGGVAPLGCCFGGSALKPPSP